VRKSTRGVGETPLHADPNARSVVSVRPPKSIVVSITLIAALAACGPSDSPSSGTTLVVFAAASLKQTFTELGQRFTVDNPGTDVDFNFAGSSDLLSQLTQGANADVFASADTRSMDKAVQAGVVSGKPVDFASNTLVIVTAPGNPENVTSFADLARPDASVVICAPQVPCGAATKTVENNTGVRLSPVSEESSVTDVLTKVTSGQADTGVVYLTDARNAGEKVAMVTFPEAAQAVNTYPIAVMKGSISIDLANKFVDLVTGDVGQKVLDEAGFAKP
jgi:molybdate transport system substrate-binding protein